MHQGDTKPGTTLNAGHGVWDDQLGHSAAFYESLFINLRFILRDLEFRPQAREHRLLQLFSEQGG